MKTAHYYVLSAAFREIVNSREHIFLQINSTHHDVFLLFFSKKRRMNLKVVFSKSNLGMYEIF
jgi:hypothetical protein